MHRADCSCVLRVCESNKDQITKLMRWINIVFFLRKCISIFFLTTLFAKSKRKKKRRQERWVSAGPCRQRNKNSCQFPCDWYTNPGFWFSVKSQCSLVSNLLNQPIKFLEIPAYSRNWQDKLGPRRFFKDGKLTSDWCIRWMLKTNNKS